MGVDTSAPTEGDVLAGRYRLQGVLGAGGFAHVRRAVDLTLDRAVAVKLVHGESASGDELSRFEREGRAAASLAHPNIVSVFDAGIDDGVAFIVMECLSGRTLADELEQGPLSTERASQVAEDLLAALAAAHRAGIVHRDVKPGNLLIDDDGCVKVGDFGIAKMQDTNVTATGIIVGTPAYLAPEQIKGERATPASDVFAAGVVLYEALTGRRPFDADTPLGVAYAVCNDDPAELGSLRGDVDPALQSVVDCALAKDPAARFSDAGEMLQALRGEGPAAQVQASQTSTQPVDISATQAVPRPRDLRRGLAARVDALAGRWVLAAVALVVVTLLMVAAVATWRAPGADDPGPEPAQTEPAADPELPAPLADALRRLEEAVTP